MQQYATKCNNKKIPKELHFTHIIIYVRTVVKPITLAKLSKLAKQLLDKTYKSPCEC